MGKRDRARRGHLVAQLGDLAPGRGDHLPDADQDRLAFETKAGFLVQLAGERLAVILAGADLAAGRLEASGQRPAIGALYEQHPPGAADARADYLDRIGLWGTVAHLRQVPRAARVTGVWTGRGAVAVCLRKLAATGAMSA